MELDRLEMISLRRSHTPLLHITGALLNTEARCVLQGSATEPLTAEVLAAARSQQTSQGGIPVLPILDAAAGVPAL